MFYYRLCAVNFRENHFSYIIVDEASQAIEPEMLIPLMITNRKHEDERIESQAQIVIAGDPYQLGPVVRSKWSKHLFGKFIQNDIKYRAIYILQK